MCCAFACGRATHLAGALATEAALCCASLCSLMDLSDDLIRAAASSALRMLTCVRCMHTMPNRAPVRRHPSSLYQWPPELQTIDLDRIDPVLSDEVLDPISHRSQIYDAPRVARPSSASFPRDPCR